MYIFELFYKIFKGKDYYKRPPKDFSAQELEQDPSDCEHFFMPLDTSEEYFACQNCGLVVSKEELEKNN